MDVTRILRIPLIFLLLLGVSCGNKNEHPENQDEPDHAEQTQDKKEFQNEGKAIQFAQGFNLLDKGNYQVLKIHEPWLGSDQSYNYLLLQKDQEIPEGVKYDQIIRVPVNRIVVTSTTHIAALEILKEEETVIGFPELDHISSKRTRARIHAGEIQELGVNEALNTEILLALQPELVVGFSIDGSNRTFSNIEQAGIPVIFNADWMEQSPLGKAEWIKFFGALVGKQEAASQFFERVVTEYENAVELAKQAENIPSVLSGSMFQDQWFLPAGESWHARFIEDANADYLYAESAGTGSLSLSIESVLSKGQDADFWLGPAQFSSYAELEAASRHYTRFKAFQNQQVYTYSAVRGETGGVVFFELAPNRPDLVLKDLISIFHPDLLPEYEPEFYTPLR